MLSRCSLGTVFAAAALAQARVIPRAPERPRQARIRHLAFCPDRSRHIRDVLRQGDLSAQEGLGRGQGFP